MNAISLEEKKQSIKAQLQSVLADHVAARTFVEDLTIVVRGRAQGLVILDDSKFYELFLGSLARVRCQLGMQSDYSIESLLNG